LTINQIGRHLSNVSAGDASIDASSVSCPPPSSTNHRQATVDGTSTEDTEEERMEHFAAILDSLRDDESTTSEGDRATTAIRARARRRPTTRIYGARRFSPSSDTDC